MAESSILTTSFLTDKMSLVLVKPSVLHQRIIYSRDVRIDDNVCLVPDSLHSLIVSHLLRQCDPISISTIDKQPAWCDQRRVEYRCTYSIVAKHTLTAPEPRRRRTYSSTVGRRCATWSLCSSPHMLTKKSNSSKSVLIWPVHLWDYHIPT